jgi:hypothetical protein
MFKSSTSHAIHFTPTNHKKHLPNTGVKTNTGTATRLASPIAKHNNYHRSALASRTPTTTATQNFRSSTLTTPQNGDPQALEIGK